jgi:hypothetical protein
MYNTPNTSTMGLSAAAIPLALTNALLQLAVGLVVIVSYLLLTRRSFGIRSREFPSCPTTMPLSASNEHRTSGVATPAREPHHDHNR